MIMIPSLVSLAIEPYNPEGVYCEMEVKFKEKNFNICLLEWYDGKYLTVWV